ncbi:MAG: sigma-70 family RNA polymerase sigma factor [Aureliella sp.]
MAAEAGEPDTDALLQGVEIGDEDSLQKLLNRHRKRLRRMVEVRLDDRIAARVDASDVVQDTLLEAAKRLPQYLAERPLAFFPWLRQIAWKRISKLHDFHIGAQRRTINREYEQNHGFSEVSLAPLAQRLLCPRPSPSGVVVDREQRQRVRLALTQLSERDREVLVLRFLEHLSPTEIASVLGIRPGAVRVRQLRALERLQSILGETGEDDREAKS